MRAAYDGRSVLLLIFLALVSFSARAQESSQTTRDLLDKNGAPALQITEKVFDEETGLLTVVLTNRSNLNVTAFAVSLVAADSTGNGTMGIQEEERFPGDGIAPGATFVMKMALGIPDPTQRRFLAQAVNLEYEIRSDNTIYGDTALSDRIFEQRAAYLVELERASQRLQSAHGDSAGQRSVLPLLQEATKEGKAAHRTLLDGRSLSELPAGEEQHERARLAAVLRVGNMMDQYLQLIETGQQSTEVAITYLEQFLESELANTARNIRPEDLQGGEQ